MDELATALIGSLVALVGGGGALWAFLPKWLDARLKNQRMQFEAETKVAIAGAQADALGDRALADAMTMASSSLSQIIQQNSSLMTHNYALVERNFELQSEVAMLRAEVASLQKQVTDLQAQLLGMQSQPTTEPHPN